MDCRVDDTIARIRERLDRRIVMAELASAAGLSVSQLNRLFHASLGMTPGVFVHQVRMTTARHLVEHTSLPVLEIMRQVGISDPSHFARDFRRAYGLSPRALRTQLRTGSASGVVGV